VNVVSVEPFGREELLERLQATRLRDGEPLYAGATLQLSPAVATDALAPAQRYVLRHSVQKILELRVALLPHGIDVFDLDGGVHVRVADDPDERIPVIPPIVEDSEEPDGRRVQIISDGMHRVFAARSVGLPITVVSVHGVAPEHPYYAYALPEGWAGVAELDELPDEFQKKEYRRPENYRSLFRDYNAQFPGVQKQRKRTNPSHLIA
jgi:hypothetical protein